MRYDDVDVKWEYNVTDALTVAEFHEWSKNDDIDRLDVVPIVTIDSDSLRIIETRQDTFPKSIVDEALQSVSISKMHEYDMDTDNYNIILTDLERTIVVALDRKTGNVTAYGKMVVRRELKMYNYLKYNNIKVKKRDIVEEMGKEKNPKKKKVTDLSFAQTVGITQLERKMKQVALHSLHEVLRKEQPGLIRYFYTGLFPDKKTPHNKSEAKMYDEMVEFLSHGWSDEQEHFGTDLVRYLGVFEGNWNTLVHQRRNLDGVR